MSTDAITLLKQDHKDVKALFRKFEQDPGDDVKGRLVTQMIELLTVHTYIEGLSRSQLQDLGAKMLEMKNTAPRKPTEPKAVLKSLDSVRA
jgi:Mor family transcriptional regulator